MSTRAQIRVIANDGDSDWHADFYRHFDGYPEATGRDLTEALEEMKTPQKMVDYLLRHDEAYEETEGLHGDIDYYYELDFIKKVFKGWECTFPPWLRETDFNQLNLEPNKTGKEFDIKTGTLYKEGERCWSIRP